MIEAAMSPLDGAMIFRHQCAHPVTVGRDRVPCGLQGAWSATPAQALEDRPAACREHTP